MPRDLAAAPPPAVVAMVLVSAQAHLSGYRLHPALLDATLHLSAAALPPAGSTPATTGATLVPAGLGAILATRLASGCQCIAPVAEPRAPEADGSTLCSYKLLPGAGCALDLCDLLAKKLPAAAAVVSPAAHQTAPAEDVPASELLYETLWEAVHAEHQAGSPLGGTGSVFELGRPARGSARAGHRLCSGSTASSRAAAFPALRQKPAALTASFSGSRPEAPAAGAATRMLELWQRAAPDLASGGALALATQGAVAQEHCAGAWPIGTGNGAAAGAALWALARVIASENPSVAVSGVDGALACSAHHAQVHYCASHPVPVHTGACAERCHCAVVEALSSRR